MYFNFLYCFYKNNINENHINTSCKIPYIDNMFHNTDDYIEPDVDVDVRKMNTNGLTKRYKLEPGKAIKICINQKSRDDSSDEDSSDDISTTTESSDDEDEYYEEFLCLEDKIKKNICDLAEKICENENIDFTNTCPNEYIVWIEEIQQKHFEANLGLELFKNQLKKQDLKFKDEPDPKNYIIYGLAIICITLISLLYFGK